MLEFPIRAIAFDLYACDWIDSHTSPEMRLASIREYYNNVDECHKDGIEPDDYHEWLFNNGYNGSIYACKSEFFNAEYLDKDYMKQLFDNDPELLAAYYEDIDDSDASDELAEIPKSASKNFRKLCCFIGCDKTSELLNNLAEIKRKIYIWSWLCNGCRKRYLPDSLFKYRVEKIKNIRNITEIPQLVADVLSDLDSVLDALSIMNEIDIEVLEWEDYSPGEVFPNEADTPEFITDILNYIFCENKKESDFVFDFYDFNKVHAYFDTEEDLRQFTEIVDMTGTAFRRDSDSAFIELYNT